ncbi:MAG: hypothetical protein BroJett040_25800 [Oligoflexia bacterium]|nr:MAG: hypothetical protein BroJett040_25800 [Oligoflexia bacterium]
MEIIFITGKGGVGKSAVAAAFALNRAQLGKKTLLVELGDQSFYSDFFNLSHVCYTPVNLKPNLDVALLSGQESLKEYALHLIKVESLYKIFFENAVTKALINVAPALPELAILGKITSGPPRNVGPKMPYDCIVVDAYASGHFEALIKAPQGMAQAIRFGPMGDQCRSIDAVLKNSNICRYYVVSLPEELPVVEACELASQIQSTLGVKPIHLLNRCLPINDEDLHHQESKDLQAFQKRMQQQLQHEKEFLTRLQTENHNVFRLPQIYQVDPWKVVETLAQEIPNA